MKLNKFLETLNEFYGKIKGTKACCKFYLQQYTFSFEIHNRDKQCFTKDSLIFESEVYWWTYNDKDAMSKIIADIKAKALELKPKK